MTGLLPGGQIDQKAEPVFAHLDQIVGRQDAGQQAGRGRQSLLVAHVHIGALDDASRRAQLGQQFDQQRFDTLDAQRQTLHDQPVAVAIYDQTGQTVALGVDQAIAVGRGISCQAGASGQRSLQSPAPERRVDRLVLVPRQQPDLDLRAAVQVAARQPDAVSALHIDDLAVGRVGVDFLDGAGEDPGVVVMDRFFPPGFEGNGRHGW